ncbi:hypothetical protein [Janibacter terrae]|uniref:hypothetical protein n=1 Tax=Janibacter terrae TaxID=103817 RepID=UPI0031F9B8ED
MDADKNMLGVLRDAGITALVDIEKFPFSSVPFVLLEPLPGTRAAGDFENAAYSMSSWAPTRGAARRLWLEAGDAIRSAWLGGDPRINFADTSALPVVVPSGVDGVWRFEGPVRASIRQ